MSEKKRKWSTLPNSSYSRPEERRGFPFPSITHRFYQSQPPQAPGFPKKSLSAYLSLLGSSSSSSLRAPRPLIWLILDFSPCHPRLEPIARTGIIDCTDYVMAKLITHRFVRITFIHFPLPHLAHKTSRFFIAFRHISLTNPLVSLPPLRTRVYMHPSAVSISTIVPLAPNLPRRWG